MRNTRDIHASLSKHGDSSWIEYWIDPDSMCFLLVHYLYLGYLNRLIRPHIALANNGGQYHPPEGGLRYWPFPGFKAYKQHQWMILSRSFVEHFRSSRVMFTMLAFMEHSWYSYEKYVLTRPLGFQTSAFLQWV